MKTKKKNENKSLLVFRKHGSSNVVTVNRKGGDIYTVVQGMIRVRLYCIMKIWVSLNKFQEHTNVYLTIVSVCKFPERPTPYLNFPYLNPHPN